MRLMAGNLGNILAERHARRAGRHRQQTRRDRQSQHDLLAIITGNEQRNRDKYRTQTESGDADTPAGHAFGEHPPAAYDRDERTGKRDHHRQQVAGHERHHGDRQDPRRGQRDRRANAPASGWPRVPIAHGRAPGRINATIRMHSRPSVRPELARQ